MKIMMADGKEVTTTEDLPPTYIVTSNSSQDNAPKKGSVTKKHVLIAVSSVVAVALVLVAILVGMHMFSQAQKEIVKFSLQFKASDEQDVKQEVESDPNDNVVMTTVTKNGQDAQIVSDFNKGIQVVKMSTGGGMSCLVLALNRSVAMDPLHISGPDSMNKEGEKTQSQETFLVSSEPVADRSFLAKKALDMCKGVSVYWVTRHCPQKVDNSTGSDTRTKRAITRIAPQYGLPGLAGCCWAVWACDLIMVEYLQGTGYTCQTFYWTGTCCAVVPAPYCKNVYFRKIC